MNTSAFGVERGTLIRMPATANLMIDSLDRDTGTCWDFQITRRQPLINGFFSRIGTTEVVLEWCGDNVSPTFGNQTFGLDVSGVGSVIGLIPAGVYTVAQALEAIKEYIDTNYSTEELVMTIDTNNGVTIIQMTVNGNPAVINVIAPQTLTNQLNWQIGQGGKFIYMDCPDLRPYRYIDFICEQLTQVQDVKDAATSTPDRDVLCRWYFSYDTPVGNDEYGFPILMGYQRFCLRRLFNPPKQIKWEQNLQLGNLKFQAYGDNGELVKTTGDTEWLMTLQLSEG